MINIREYIHLPSMEIIYMIAKGKLMFFAAQLSLVLNTDKKSFLDH